MRLGQLVLGAFVLVLPSAVLANPVKTIVRGADEAAEYIAKHPPRLPVIQQGILGYKNVDKELERRERERRTPAVAEPPSYGKIIDEHTARWDAERAARERQPTIQEIINSSRLRQPPPPQGAIQNCTSGAPGCGSVQGVPAR